VSNGVGIGIGIGIDARTVIEVSDILDGGTICVKSLMAEDVVIPTEARA